MLLFHFDYMVVFIKILKAFPDRSLFKKVLRPNLRGVKLYVTWGVGLY